MATELKAPGPTDFARQGGRIRALDGLRGVAVLAVIGFHGGVPLTSGGFIGVDVFFVLSGFLITSIIATEQQLTGRISLKNFYLRRLLRLAPALLLLLAVYCVYSLLFSRTPQRNLVDALIALFYAMNWARAYWLDAPLDLGHTWSLSSEEQFYLTWPLLLMLLLPKLGLTRTAWLALGLALCSWAARAGLLWLGATDRRVYSGLDTHADGLLLGCALALACTQLSSSQRRITLPSMAPLAALSVLGTILALASWNARVMFFGGYALANAAAALVIASLVLGSSGRIGALVRAALELRPLVWVGGMSYGLYLWHYPIFRVLRAAGLGRFPTLGIGVLLTFAIAFASFKFVEKPALRLKKRYEFAAVGATTAR